MSSLPPHLEWDEKGRFKAKEIPLEDKVKEALIGELLGDGHLRFTKKG